MLKKPTIDRIVIDSTSPEKVIESAFLYIRSSYAAERKVGISPDDVSSILVSRETANKWLVEIKYYRSENDSWGDVLPEDEVNDTK